MIKKSKYQKEKINKKYYIVKLAIIYSFLFLIFILYSF